MNENDMLSKDIIIGYEKAFSNQIQALSLEESIGQVLGQLFSGNGRLSDVNAISEFGIVRYFKHTNGDDINWVKQAIGNCLKKK